MLERKPYIAAQKLWSICMDMGSWICPVMVSQLKGTGT